MRTAAPMRGLKVLLRPMSRPGLIATVVAIGVVAGAGFRVGNRALAVGIRGHGAADRSVARCILPQQGIEFGLSARRTP
jgi:hypothetical protein